MLRISFSSYFGTVRHHPYHHLISGFLSYRLGIGFVKTVNESDSQEVVVTGMKEIRSKKTPYLATLQLII